MRNKRRTNKRRPTTLRQILATIVFVALLGVHLNTLLNAVYAEAMFQYWSHRVTETVIADHSEDGDDTKIRPIAEDLMREVRLHRDPYVDSWMLFVTITGIVGSALVCLILAGTPVTVLQRKKPKPPQLTSRLQSLISALRNLAADPEDQIAYLKSLGTWPETDELALEWSDAADPIEWLTDHLPLDADLLKHLVRINAQLDAMSGESNAPLWDAEALDTREEWATVRQLARKCLPKLERLIA